MSPPLRYLPLLDLARFGAAVWVMAAHYLYIGPMRGLTPWPVSEGGALLAMLHSGYLGVALFFAISGFVIAGVAERSPPLGFLIARGLRIAPAYWLCMSLTAIVLVLLGSPRAPDAATWAANLILVPQMFGRPFVEGVAWSLLYEAVFYAWITLLVVFGGMRPPRLVAVCTVWLVLAVADRLLLPGGSVLSVPLMSEFAGWFVFGLALHLAVRHPAVRPLALALMVAALPVAAEGLSTFASLIEDGQVLYPAPGLATRVAGVIALFAVTAVCVLLPQPRELVPAALLLGSVSYPLYLLHQEIGYALLTHMADMPRTLAIGLLGSGMIALATLVHLVAERPLRRLLGGLVARPTARVPAPARPACARRTGWLRARASKRSPRAGP